MSVLEVIYQYRFAYLSGLYVTLKLCCFAWIVGLTGGSIIALGAEWWPRFLGWPLIVLSRITEAIPIMVLLFWLHYPIQAALGVVVDPFYTTTVLLAALNVLAVFNILRAAISRVPAELVEVARVCGVTRRRAFWLIKCPLALRSSVGALTSSQVNVLQLSIFGSLIAVAELFRVAQRINSQIYQPVQVYSGIALFFLSVCLPLNLLSRYLDRKVEY
jgi:polar amino acid transport system permease protein